ncbi:uncharacterized protein LOC118912817 isoform X2 [Manis pentadactyla]|uniref:uncharacterized protein LOC118912817 isoform X2 n=1 Tax=Manis pentadactyla TaxID=143292 RepID=UPI00255C7AAE|nr:uncharacterized protein LOC118912817 isoform X2 [Manis pentadactyla]
MGGGGTGGAGPSAAPLLGSRLATARRAPGVRPTFLEELAGRPGTPGTSGHLLAAVGDMELAASWAAGAFVELLPGLRDGCYPGWSRGVLESRPGNGAWMARWVWDGRRAARGSRGSAAGAAVGVFIDLSEQDLEITSVKKKKGLMEVNTTTHRVSFCTPVSAHVSYQTWILPSLSRQNIHKSSSGV